MKTIKSDWSGLHRAAEELAQAFRDFGRVAVEAFREIRALQDKTFHTLFDLYQRTRWQRSVDRAWFGVIREGAATVQRPPATNTRLRAINRTGMPHDWELYDTQGNRLRLPCKSIDIRARVNQANAIDLTCELVAAQVEAQPQFLFQHPVSGKMQPIESITWSDGTEWAPGAYYKRGGAS